MNNLKLSSCKNNFKKLFIVAVYEKNVDYMNNILYFIENAFIHDIDYLFVINGEISFIDKFVNLNYIKRPNIGYDFGAYLCGLQYIGSKVYDYYFFMNSSTKGPFIPSYVDKTYDDIFISLFKQDIHLVSPSIIFLDKKSQFININQFDLRQDVYPICQTCMFVLDSYGLNLLQKYNFFDRSQNIVKFMDACYLECLMSCLMLQENANLACLMTEYQNIDFRKINTNYLSVNPIEPYGLFGDTMHPFEFVFHKNNRNLNKYAINRYSNNKHV